MMFRHNSHLERPLIEERLLSQVSGMLKIYPDMTNTSSQMHSSPEEEGDEATDPGNRDVPQQIALLEIWMAIPGLGSDGERSTMRKALALTPAGTGLAHGPGVDGGTESVWEGGDAGEGSVSGSPPPASEMEVNIIHGKEDSRN